VRFLENDAAEIDGVVFLGCTLWTDFTLFGDPPSAMQEAETLMNDYRLIRVSPSYRRLRPADTLLMNAKSTAWLKQAIGEHQGKPLVVVTHHAPSMLSVQEQYKEDVVSAAFASPLDALVSSSHAKFRLHGHVHKAARYAIGQTQMLCNPRGYPDETNTGFDAALIVEL
jgi:Icc-related predicted phosphoesterase